MSGTEEVPNTRPTEKPILWKEYSLLDKVWYWTQFFLPHAIFLAFGFFCLWLSGRNLM